MSLLAPNPNNLGVDSWSEREAWTELYSNAFSAIILPSRHEDAEINHRVKSIKSAILGPLDPRRIENVCYDGNGTRWLKEYVYGRKSTYSDHEVFAAIRDGLYPTFFAIFPPLQDGDIYYMSGQIVPGEYERFLAHMLRYRLPASVEAPCAIVKGFCGSYLPVFPKT